MKNIAELDPAMAIKPADADGVAWHLPFEAPMKLCGFHWFETDKLYVNNGKKHMLIVYREELIDEIAAEIKNLDFGKMRLKIYVFSPGRYAFNDNFREVEDKVELVALPAAIYDAYQKVLPKRREKLFETEEKKETSPMSQDLFANEEEGGEA